MKLFMYMNKRPLMDSIEFLCVVATVYILARTVGFFDSFLAGPTRV